MFSPKYLIILALSVSVSLSGQDCFVVGYDNTGLENQVSILEQSACSLRDSLPSVFQDDFKVIHVGLYIHTQAMADNFDEFRTNAILRAQSISPNFLLIIHKLYYSGHSEYDIEIQLPENWPSNCYDELVLSAFTNSVRARFMTLQNEYPSPPQKTQVETKGIEYMANKIGEFTGCCLPEGNLRSPSCTNCITAQDVLNELDNLGFTPYFIGEVTNSDLNVDQNCLCTGSTSSSVKPNDNQNNRSTSNLEDYAGLTVNVDGVTYDFATQLSEWVSLGNRGIITKNSNYCDQALFQGIQSSFYGSSNAVWVHIWENPEEDNDDIVFLKMKQGSENEVIAPQDIQIQQFQGDTPPPFEYVIMHRSFAPWDWFGHIPLFYNVHVAKNSFQGDNRGFSLGGSVSLPPGTTARIHQNMKVRLGEGEIPIGGDREKKFSSITRGYVNFQKRVPKRIVPHPYKQELDRWEYEPAQVEEDFCSPDGFENSMVQDNITYTAMFFEGSDPLIVFPMIAPDIEWYIELGMYYLDNESSLNINGRLIGKSFPAYEAYLEDKCGNKMFLYTYPAPCESELAIELLNPIADYNEGFDISVRVDENGCFLDEMITTYDGNTQNTVLPSWNQHHLSKAAAKDCPDNPCQGAYTNDGLDRRSDFNCGGN